jgi:hypothetical protein
LVRNELAELLKENPPYGRTPDPSQLVAFAAEWKRTNHGAAACNATTTDFMVDVAGTPRSPWNVSASRVFANYMVEKMGYDDTEETRKAIEKAFSTRIKSLRLCYKRDMLSPANKTAAKSEHSRYQRKYQVIVISSLWHSVTHLQSSYFIGVEASRSCMDRFRGIWKFWTNWGSMGCPLMNLISIQVPTR